MRVRLDLSYDGSAFCGFQVQKNGVTVQGQLCRALEILMRAPVAVSGCSRTDAGVHARHFVCHAVLDADELPHGFVKSLNALLPRQIAVSRALPVSEEFHARYSARQKTYRYYILNRPQRAPLWEGRALHVARPLDVGRMQTSAKDVLGTHDFRAFQAANSSVRDTVRTITDCRIVCKDEGLLFLSVTADGFLYRMVRNLAGTLLDIGLGKELSIREILAGKDRTKAGRCAPAHGLYLWQVDYD